MNNLTFLEKWCNDLSIKTIAKPTYLMIDRSQLTELVGNENDVLRELKSLNTKLFISTFDDDWYYVESF